MYRYTINGTDYVQKPLVFGQVAQLTTLMKGIEFEEISPSGIIAGLGDKLSDAIAIVLRKDGQPLAEKDLAAVNRDLEEIEFATVLKVVADFFECNPIQSLLESVVGITAALKQATTGLKSLSVSSPAEMSPVGSQSSGA